MSAQWRIEKTGCEAARRGRWIVLVGCGIGLVVLGGVLWCAVDLARQAAIHSGCKCPLGSLHLAMHSYHAAYGHLPPAYLADKDGKPLHSWRVLILPYVEEQDLYDARFDEPWNGPNNIRLAHKMPKLYHCPSEPDSDSTTNYVVFRALPTDDGLKHLGVL
ncbi:MAG: DUF1559 domain-containing protein, partial [Patescibacteria group bacterium]|nr:DUF1559 domain-containing protein [Patescibacteria group bacterium]